MLRCPVFRLLASILRPKEFFFNFFLLFSPFPRRGCVEACYCKDPNYVLRGDKCVLKSNCPCYFEGKEYEPGSTRIEKCNTW